VSSAIDGSLSSTAAGVVVTRPARPGASAVPAWNSSCCANSPPGPTCCAQTAHQRLPRAATSPVVATAPVPAVLDSTAVGKTRPVCVRLLTPSPFGRPSASHTT
jgi:hypothetical protein